MTALKKYAPPVMAHLLLLAPVAWLAWDLWQGRLGADPIREIQLRTGRYAIILLAVSLAGTPLHAWFGGNWPLAFRRLTGVYGFAYAGLHLLNFVWIDYGFNWGFIREDVLTKRFALAGLAAFILLIPAAITSTRGWQQRLGRRWKYLHRLIYPAVLLAAVHFIWQAKLDIRVPLIFTAVIILLLVIRLPVFSRMWRKTTPKGSAGGTG